MLHKSKQVRARNRNRPNRQSRQMLFEPLEDRRLMTADLGGNSLAAATDLGTLQSSRVISDYVGRSDVNDYYRLRLGQQSELRLGLENLRADADLRLLDASGRTITSSTREGASAESITRTLAPGTYFVRVYRYSGDTNYRLALSAAPLQSTVPDNAGNSLAGARNLGVLSGERSYSDFVGNSDRDDYYRFQLGSRSAFDLSLAGLRADADVQLLDASGRSISSSTRGGNQSEAISRTLDAGTYFVRVYRYSGDTNYTLTLRARADGPPDNAGNTLAQARNIGTLTGSMTFNDFVGQADTADYYRFRIDARSNFQLRLENLTADADVVLLDAAGRQLVGSYRGGSNAEAIDRVLESGEYFVQVYPYGAANTNYRLSVAGTASQTVGWASQTGFRAAETAVQQAIVQRAQNQVGQASPPSRLAHSGGGWYTDVADGDGARMRTAFAAYHNWRAGNPGGTPPSTVTDAMHHALSATYTTATHRAQLVNRIIAVYEDRLNRNLPVVPQDDQQVLDFLGIRQQCVEWANASVAMPAGGSYRSHGSTRVTDLTLVRPGMGLSNGTHFMVITDVSWNAAGQPVQVRVAESNADSNWSNPVGQRPWERTIGSRAFNVAGLIGSTYWVVSFE